MRAINKTKGPEPPEFKTKVGNFIEETAKALDKNSKLMLRSHSAQPYSKKSINQILEKIDSHVFLGRTRAYDAFKLFVKDKDGNFVIISLFKNIFLRLHNKRRFVQKISRIKYFKPK